MPTPNFHRDAVETERERREEGVSVPQRTGKVRKDAVVIVGSVIVAVFLLLMIGFEVGYVVGAAALFGFGLYMLIKEPETTRREEIPMGGRDVPPPEREVVNADLGSDVEGR